MQIATQSQPIGVDDGQYLGACRKTSGLFANVGDKKAWATATRNRVRARQTRAQKAVGDRLPKVCTTCGYTGTRAEFYANRKVQDTCAPCRSAERARKIGESHAAAYLDEGLPDAKVCTQCQVEKPSGNFRVIKTKNRKFPTLAPVCDACGTLARKGAWQDMPEAERKTLNKLTVAKRAEKEAGARLARRAARELKNSVTASCKDKSCNTCGAVKSVEHFSPDRRKLDGRVGKCKSCEAAAASGRRALDPEGYLKKMQVRNAKSPERQRNVQSSRQAALKHPEWAEPAGIRAVFALAEAMAKASGREYAVDHIYPLKNPMVCGLHVACNLRVVPRRTNSKKLNKLPGHLANELWDPSGPDVFYEAQEVCQ